MVRGLFYSFEYFRSGCYHKLNFAVFFFLWKARQITFSTICCLRWCLFWWSYDMWDDVWFFAKIITSKPDTFWTVKDNWIRSLAKLFFLARSRMIILRKLITYKLNCDLYVGKKRIFQFFACYGKHLYESRIHSKIINFSFWSVLIGPKPKKFQRLLDNVLLTVWKFHN